MRQIVAGNDLSSSQIRLIQSADVLSNVAHAQEIFRLEGYLFPCYLKMILSYTLVPISLQGYLVRAIRVVILSKPGVKRMKKSVRGRRNTMMSLGQPGRHVLIYYSVSFGP